VDTMGDDVHKLISDGTDILLLRPYDHTGDVGWLLKSCRIERVSVEVALEGSIRHHTLKDHEQGRTVVQLTIVADHGRHLDDMDPNIVIKESLFKNMSVGDFFALIHHKLGERERDE